jgi:hypothetical protein
MAKSIFEILDALTTETSVPEIKSNVAHTLPRKLFPTAEQFENAESLLVWANEQKFTHALLQMGLQKGLIDCRATFKSCKKDDTWSAEYGQANVNKMNWTITERPKQGSTAKIKAEAELTAGINMAAAMKLNNIPVDNILACLVPVYGADVAKKIIDNLK